MQKKYYIDTCIWRDYFENRGDRDSPIGEWAHKFIQKIILQEGCILFSELIERELPPEYFMGKRIFDLLIPQPIMIRVSISWCQRKEALDISLRYNIPPGDALHAILARDNQAILISRNHHLFKHDFGITVRKPEDLL